MLTMTDRAPLHEVIIPEDKDPEEYTKEQRSRYMHEKIMELGHPDLLHRTNMAEKFGVTRQTIHHDLDKVVFPYMEEQLGRYHMEKTSAVFNKVIRSLIQEEKYDKAAKNAERWNQWLTDRGVANKTPDEVQVSLADEQDEELLDEMF